MNRKAAIPLVLGLVIGLVAVKFVMDSVKKAQGANKGQEKFGVVQARIDIGAFEEITPDMVQLIETSDSVLAPPQERLSELKLVEGRVTAKPVPQNGLVLKSMLAPEGTQPGIIARIPPGFRAVAVKIDEVIAGGYNMQPGDWVDVIVVMDLETGGGARAKKETIAEVILQRVQIAAIGQGTSNEADQPGGKVKPAKSATLLVKEEDVPKLHLAQTRGKITLAMRGSDDKSMGEPPIASSREMGPLAQVVPAPSVQPSPTPRLLPFAEQPEPEPHTVLVYHTIGGGAKAGQFIERITFESVDSPKIVGHGFGNPTRTGDTMSSIRRRGDSGSTLRTPESDTIPQPGEGNPPNSPSDEDTDGVDE